VIEAITFSEVY